MKIGTIFQHPLDYSLGTQTRVLGLAGALSNEGVEMHLFSPLEKSQKIGKNLFLHNIQTSMSSMRLYKIIRVFYNYPLFARTLIINKRMLIRAKKQLTNSVLESIQKNGLKLDIIQGEQEIPSLSAIAIANELKIPSVAHFHNIWAEEAVDIGLVKDQSELLIALTKEIVDSADLVLTPSLYMKKYLQEKYLARNIEYIPTTVPSICPRINDGRFKVVYSGMIAKHENVEAFIKAACIVSSKKPNVAFYVTGKGDYVSKLKNMAKKENCPIKFVWFPKKEEYFSLLSSSHIGVIPWEDKLSRRLGYPSKLLDYASAGMAVVSTNIGGWTEIITKEQMGLLAEPAAEDLAAKIDLLLDSPTLMSKMGANSQTYALTQSDKESTKILVKAYSNLLKLNIDSAAK